MGVKEVVAVREIPLRLGNLELRVVAELKTDEISPEVVEAFEKFSVEEVLLKLMLGEEWWYVSPEVEMPSGEVIRFHLKDLFEEGDTIFLIFDWEYL